MPVWVWLLAWSLWAGIGYSQCSTFGPNLVTCGDFDCPTPLSTFTTAYPGPPALPLSMGGSGLFPENTYTIANNPNLYHTAFVCPCTTANATLPAGCDCAPVDRFCPPGDNQLIVNGSSTPQVVWEQTITGLNIGSYYQFNALVDNVLPGSFALTDPLVRVLVNGVPLSADLNVPECPEVPQNWECGFQAGTSSITLTIINLSIDPSGNDFAIDDITLRECLDAGVTLSGCDLSIPLAAQTAVFTAQWNDVSRAVQLAFRTSDFSTVSQFSIERWQHNAWAPVLRIPRNATPTDEYQTTDPDPVPGYNRYRLRTIDGNGQYGIALYAEIQVPADQLAVRIVPNPIGGTFIVQSAETTPFTVHATDGQQVLTGNTNQLIGSDRLAPGVYVVRLPDGSTLRMLVPALP